ncbi:MAG: D-2-hydroxyacid dehydrogenase family protein [Rhodobacteraceae bacterium]|nr:D-2-hydroxyacid dehydrogenase family protein [Paracoccaceae bacterium]
MKVHILDDWFDTLRGLPCFRLLDGHDVTVWTDHEPDPTKLATRLQEAEAIVLFRERTKISAALLERLPRLKLISQRSVYPHVDVAACSANNVLLCSHMHSDTPSYAAAEMTLALMLASYRQIPEQAASLKAGNWQMGVGRTLRGRTLGLYGYGRARARADGKMVPDSRAAFFATSDIVSLHVRLKPATKGIVTAGDLAAMQPRALLVNTSRSGLIETGALEAEVARGRIHAAIDVFDPEPMRDTENILATHPNVLATPHIGYVTEDEFDLQFRDIFEQINAYADGAPIHMINPEVLA